MALIFISQYHVVNLPFFLKTTQSWALALSAKILLIAFSTKEGPELVISPLSLHGAQAHWAGL